MNKVFWKAALIRAAKTFLQTILGVWTAGRLITDLDWKAVLLASFSAAVYSLLTSIVAGLPEVDSLGGEMTEDEAEMAIEENEYIQDELDEIESGDDDE